MKRKPSQFCEDPAVLEAVARVCAGDVESFAVLVESFQAVVAADLSRRLQPQDVEAVAQDTFVRAFRALPSYGRRAPFRIWLLQIARRAAMDFWRKHYRNRETPFSAFESEEEADHAVEDRLAGASRGEHAKEADRLDELRETLSAALNRLPPDDRALIILVELEGTPLADAAAQLHCSLAAIKVRAFRARQRLKKILQEMLPERSSS